MSIAKAQDFFSRHIIELLDERFGEPLTVSEEEALEILRQTILRGIKLYESAVNRLGLRPSKV